jgi:ribose transport system permease protein
MSVAVAGRSRLTVGEFLRLHLQRTVLCVLIVALLTGFRVFSPQMLSGENLKNILVQTAYLMIFASGQTMVLLARGFDMSLGNTVSLVSVVTALCLTWMGDGSAVSIIVAFAGGLFTGFLVGLANGILVSVLRINPFIVTLGTMNIVATLSSTVSGGFPVSNLPDAFVAIAAQSIFGLPIQIWIMIVAVLVLNFVLWSTVFGRVIFLMGANPNAARMAGTSTRFHTTAAYVACSLIAAIGAILLTSRMGSGEPSVGSTLTLETIAAAVVGGISLKGGEGDAFAPAIGALFITVLSNGMNLTGVDGYIQQIALGVIIVVSLALDRRSHSA